MDQAGSTQSRNPGQPSFRFQPMNRTHMHRAVALSLSAGLAALALVSCDRASSSSITGDWDYYRMLGAAPTGDFDGLRRFGFAPFARADTAGAFINRRLGPRLEHIRELKVERDSLILTLAGTTAIRAHIGKDTISGQYYRD